LAPNFLCLFSATAQSYPVAAISIIMHEERIKILLNGKGIGSFWQIAAPSQKICG